MSLPIPRDSITFETSITHVVHHITDSALNRRRIEVVDAIVMQASRPNP
jgi:hypothetical protein